LAGHDAPLTGRGAAVSAESEGGTAALALCATRMIQAMLIAFEAAVVRRKPDGTIWITLLARRPFDGRWQSVAVLECSRVTALDLSAALQAHADREWPP
jgi:hypothetical protein